MNVSSSRQLVIESVACCGLICALDSCYKNCDGCRSGKGCGDSQCFQKECCKKRNIDGCWQCSDFPCENGYFSDNNTSKGQFVGCVQFIRKEGIEKYVERVIRNSSQGIKYGLKGDYANKTIEEVLKMLEASTNISPR